jgi:hypothetical protein
MMIIISLVKALMPKGFPLTSTFGHELGKNMSTNTYDMINDKS